MSATHGSFGWAGVMVRAQRMGEAAQALALAQAEGLRRSANAEACGACIMPSGMAEGLGH